MFLAVLKTKVIDVAFEAAIPEILEVIEDLTEDPPIIGVLGVPAVPQVDEVSHLKVGKTFIENNVEQVVQNLEAAVPNLDYYSIQNNGAQLVATLHPVSLKSGPRAAASTREVVEIVANGQDAGSAIMDT